MAYTENKEYHILRPDFIFFSKNEDDYIVANIIDLYGFHLVDALPKLIGLATYAETHGSFYCRIEAVTKLGGKFRPLDLTDSAVRLEINKAAARSPFGVL